MAGATPCDPLSARLRAVYDDVLDEPLPPRLLELLAQLDDDDNARDAVPVDWERRLSRGLPSALS